MTNRLTMTWAVRPDPIHGTKLVATWIADRQEDQRQRSGNQPAHRTPGPVGAVPWVLIQASPEQGPAEPVWLFHDEAPAPLDFGTYAFLESDDPRIA